MTDSTLNRFLASGTNAARLAFVPVPPTPASGPDPTYIWYEEDTGDTYAWDYAGSAWALIASAGGGLPAATTTEVLTGTSVLVAATPDALAALWEKGSDITSAATISVGEGGFFHVTGTVTITDIDFGTTKAGRAAKLVFDDVLTLTHNATTLILPTGASIITAAGDTCLVVSEGGDNVRVTDYTRKSGTALALASPTFPAFTTPIDGDFAWVNQGGASVTVNADGGIFLRAPLTTGPSIRIRKKAAPGGTPYTLTAAMFGNVVTLNFQSAGIVFRQSSDGKLVLFSLSGSNSGTYISVFKFTDATNFSATAFELAVGRSAGLVWLRVTDSGANRIFYYSLDGYNFIQLFSEARTTFLTADEIGFFANDQTNAYDAAMTLKSWAQT